MQSAAVALCYFCENHGPRVVITCQPMRSSSGEQPHSNNDYVKKKVENAEKKDEEAEGGEGGQISSTVEMEVDCEATEEDYCGDLDNGNEIVDDELRCAACSSFEQGVGLISNDHEARISYISTQVPISERLNHVLKQACLRSLSVEISAPLFVETEQQQANDCCGYSSPSSSTSAGVNHNHHFQPKCQTLGILREDSERDGVVLFGDDEHWYTLSYTFRLKDAKARGFHRSYSMVVISTDKLLLLRNYDFLVNELGRIIGNLQTLTEAFFALEQTTDSELRLASNVSISSKGPQHWLPHQFYPKQYKLDTKRSLKIISNTEAIFSIIHRQMLNLLKTLNALDKEIVLEGCPTQDMLTVMELKNSNSLDERELVTQLSPRQSLAHLANLRIIVDRLKEAEESSNRSEAGLALLTILIWQVVVGGQVVVRSSSLTARRFFLLALIQLVPVGCVRLATNSKQYSYIHRHNFLGCPPNVQIPDDAFPELVLVTINRNREEDIASDSDNNSKFGQDTLRRFTFRVDSWPRRSEREKPSIVDRYERLLLEPVLNDITLGSALQSTRNDWLNNAKLIFQLRHQRNAIDLDQILRIIKCQPKDSPVILFWQMGLSKRYKQAVLGMASNCAAAPATVHNPNRGGGAAGISSSINQ